MSYLTFLTCLCGLRILLLSDFSEGQHQRLDDGPISICCIHLTLEYQINGGLVSVFMQGKEFR